MPNSTVAKRIQIYGIVQGVGFRPFIYTLANRYNLKGTVTNTSYGVLIHIEGLEANSALFSRDILDKAPPLAHITDIREQDDTFRAYKNFEILHSSGGSSRETLISPDISICQDCLAELFDTTDRRYLYPFINCTNCGPRYTIIDDIPYDRAHTSMKHFKMCGACQAEYDDPKNRRFHAQPNACAHCGPQVELFDNQGNKIECDEPVKTAADLLRKGHIIAIKGLGGFHLAVDAQNNDAVTSLRNRKHRAEKPFALMSMDLGQVSQYALVSETEKELLLSPFRPIVILKKSTAYTLSPQVAPGTDSFGVMLPYTPLHYILLNEGFTALVMTSGNHAEEPIAIHNDEAFDRLSGIADFFLVHDRDIYLRSDDSIVKHVADNTRFMRRSRGYVPAPLILGSTVPPILGCGAELKNTICLTNGNMAFLSQHMGDLENIEAFEFFKSTVRQMKRILGITPRFVAHDLHPNYLSTRFALEQADAEPIPVQHHHAHIASCMAEHQLHGDVIGLSFDGTGYGTDGNFWGGEVLIAGMQTFSRIAHLSYVPMPGGDRVIKEPWRMAVSYLHDAFGETLWDLDIPFMETTGEQIVKRTTMMMQKQVNSPLTSSLGRLFDGVASLIGLRHHVSYEGQAAMELELAVQNSLNHMDHPRLYDIHVNDADQFHIPVKPIIQGVVADIKAGVTPAVISGTFHMTIIRLFCDVCEHIRRNDGLDRVVLSGGVFQNSILLEGFLRSLNQAGFAVYTHSKVPSNDGGISLGQAVVAAAVAGIRLNK